MKFTDHLKTIYIDFEPETWVHQNSFVFHTAKKCGLAICGSIAIAVGRKKAIKKPGDIDFVASDLTAATAFVGALQAKLFQYPSFWKVMINNQTSFCPPGCVTHFRIQTGFWMPICVMVLPKDKFNIWYTEGGQIIQQFNNVIDAASELQERDGKERVTEEVLADKESIVEQVSLAPFVETDFLEEQLPEPWDVRGFTPQDMDFSPSPTSPEYVPKT